MVLIHMLQIGWFLLPFADWIIALITWPALLAAFFFRRKVTGDAPRRVFLVPCFATLVICEFLWFMIPGFARYCFMFADHIALTLLAGYALGAAWPHIKQWWKENT